MMNAYVKAKQLTAKWEQTLADARLTFFNYLNRR